MKFTEQALGKGYTAAYVADYMAETACFDRLILIEDHATRIVGFDYWRHHLRILRMTEVYPQHHMFELDGFKEQQSASLFALQRIHATRYDNQTQLDAERLVQGTLANTFFKELTSGPCSNPLKSVARHWNARKGANADIALGISAEYRR